MAPTQDDLGSNNPFNVGSFFFANAAKNSPLSYEALQTRRKIAESLLGRRSQLPFPKTLGEGLTYASKELADAYENRQTLADLEQRDREFQQGASQLPIPGAGPVPPTAAPPGAAAGSAADNGSGDGGGSPVVAAADTGLSPYAPSAAGPDETPLPPPRPLIDRSRQLGDMNEDPSLLPRLAATTMGELNPGASLPEQRTQFATALDRAGARSIPLSQALETYTGRGSRGYYPPDVVPRGAAQLRTPEQQQAFMRNVATPVLRGADPGGAALGFTPTGNASGGVADRGIASGRYGNAGSFPGRNETYVTQESGRPLPFSAGGPDTTADATPGANPDATRNAIASAMMAAPPVPFAGGVGAPGGGPDATAPAGPGNTQVASLGDASGLLGNLRPQGAARQMDREAPLMPVPQGVPGNPAIQSDISPAPPPQQVAQLMGQGAQGGAGGAGGAGGGGPAPVLGSLPPGIPNTKPVPPILNTQPTKEEIFGMQLLSTHPNPADPVNQRAKAYIAFGQQQRQSAFAQQQEAYKADVAAWMEGAKSRIRVGEPAYQQGLVGDSGGPAGPGAGPGIATDPRLLGTPQSPQRNGVPEVAPPPPGVTPKQWSTTQAPIVAARVEAVTKAVPQFEEMIKTIGAVRDHEGKESGTGPLGNIARSVNGTKAYDFNALLNQLKGKNFLQAYQLLKGAGAISNIEGEKSEQAQAALDPNQSTRGFNSGLQRLEDQVRGDLEIAQRRMHMPVTAWRKGNDNTSYAPDIGQVYRGMRYIGGDPHDTANSWVREQ